jgi:hypothetical protein
MAMDTTSVNALFKERRERRKSELDSLPEGSVIITTMSVTVRLRKRGSAFKVERVCSIPKEGADLRHHVDDYANDYTRLHESLQHANDEEVGSNLFGITEPAKVRDSDCCEYHRSGGSHALSCGGDRYEPDDLDLSPQSKDDVVNAAKNKIVEALVKEGMPRSAAVVQAEKLIQQKIGIDLNDPRS